MQNGHWGLINEDGKVYEKCIYKSASQIYHGNNNLNARFWDGTNIHYYTNDLKRHTIPKGYVHWNQLSPSRFCGIINGQSYLTDKLGNKIIPDNFDYLDKTTVNGVFEFCANGKNGLIDSNGAVIIDFPLLPIFQQSIKFFYVQHNKIMTIYNYKGHKLAEDSFITANTLSTDSFCLKADYGYSGGAIFNNRGEIIFKYPAQSEVFSLRNNFVCIRYKEKYKIIDLTNNQTIPGFFENIESSPIINTFVFTRNYYKYFYSRITPDSGVGPFIKIETGSRGAWVQDKNFLFGYLDSNLKISLPIQYDYYAYLKDPYWAITDSSQKQSIFNLNTLKNCTEFIYNEFTTGDDYIKAYTQEGEMDLFDVLDGNLSDPIHYKNVQRRKINKRIEVDTSSARRNNQNRNSISTAKTRYYWKYVKQGKEQLLTLLFTDSTGHIDTLIKPFGHEIIYSEFPFTVIARRDPKYPSVYKDNHRRLFIADMRNYKIMSEAFDFIETKNMGDEKSTVFMAVKNNGKSVLIDKETLSESEEYEFISTIDSDCRRVVKNGKRQTVQNSPRTNYYGTIYPNTGDIYGVWGITDINGKSIPIEKTKAERVTYIDQFHSMRAYVYEDSGHVMLISNTGKIMIPPKYYDIQNIYFQPNNYYFLAKRPSATKVYVYNPKNSGLCENYKGVVDLKECIAAFDGNETWLLRSDGKKIKIPANCELKPYKNGLSFMKQDNGWVAVNKDLMNINTQVYKKVIYGVPESKYFLAAQGGKWGLINERAEWAQLPSFQGVPGPVYFTSFKLNVKNNISLVLFNGKSVPKPDNYAVALEEIEPGIFLFQNKSNYILSNSTGIILVKIQADEKPSYLNGFLLFKFNGIEKVLNTKTGQSNFLPKGLTIKKILNNQYYRNPDRYWVADFSDIQKTILPELNIFKPIRLKNNQNMGAKYQYELNQKGLYLTVINENEFLKLLNNGTPQYPNFNHLASVDSNGILLNTHAHTGLLNFNGTWAIAPFYPQLNAMGGGFYSSGIDWIYELWDMNGNKIAYTFDGYMQHAHSITMINGNEMKLYNFESKKFIALPPK